MKKFIITIILVLVSLQVFAQTDTLVIRKPIEFDSEVIVSKSGKEYTKYYATYYESTKTSFERYYLIKRFNGGSHR